MLKLRSFLILIALTMVSLSASASGPVDTEHRDWPQFRGRNASGVTGGAAPPVTWDVESGDNIAWSVDIPGLGHASPIVSGDFVFVVTAVADDDSSDLKVGLYGDIDSVMDESPQTWKLMCLSRRTGQIFWTRDLHHGVPKIKRHTKATHANSTPAADGRFVVAFLGSEGLYCFDYLGNLKWKKELGTLDSGYYVAPAAQWGFASSPIIHADRVIVQCDVQSGSFLASFNIATGEEVWRTDRSDVPTWGTPTVYRNQGRELLAVNGYRHSGGYDFHTGEEIWKLDGGGDIPVPTPIVHDGRIFLSSAHGPARPLRAISVAADGDLRAPDDRGETPLTTAGSEAVEWWRERDGIYMPTPIAVNDYLYCCSDRGVLSCYDSATGERLYRQRLGTGGLAFTASAVATADHLYFPAEDGSIYVVAPGPEFEQLGRNLMQDICMASPAIAHGLLYIRTKSKLFAIGSRPAPAPPLNSRFRCRCR